MEPKPPGLWGSIEYAGMLFTEHLLQPFNMVNVYGGHCMGLSQYSDMCQFQLLALTDHIGFSPGQVFYYSSGQYSENSIGGEFISANSYTEWLTRYAQQLSESVYPVIDGHIYRFYREPSTVAVTGGIEISVATTFLSSESSIEPPHFVHAYRITMSMDENASSFDSSQLESRHWTITDEDGREEKVSGLGVVGEFPVMKPGKSFTWVSSTHFRTTYGSMKGHFVMRNLATGVLFNVECPIFHMKCLPYQTSIDRIERALRSKKDQ